MSFFFSILDGFSDREKGAGLEEGRGWRYIVNYSAGSLGLGTEYWQWSRVRLNVKYSKSSKREPRVTPHSPLSPPQSHARTPTVTSRLHYQCHHPSSIPHRFPDTCMRHMYAFPSPVDFSYSYSYLLLHSPLPSKVRCAAVTTTVFRDASFPSPRSENP